MPGRQRRHDGAALKREDLTPGKNQTGLGDISLGRITWFTGFAKFRKNRPSLRSIERKPALWSAIGRICIEFI
jgi:hypothetical protein